MSDSESASTSITQEEGNGSDIDSLFDFLDGLDGWTRISCFTKFRINVVHIPTHNYFNAFSVRVEWTALVKLDLFARHH